MEQLLKKRWVQVTLGVIAAFVLGIAVTLFFTERRLTDVFQSHAMTVEYKPTGGYGGTAIQGSRIFLDDLEIPLTATKATAGGWSSLGPCVDGRGAAYVQATVDQPQPLIALYSAAGQLIGVNLISPEAQPSPPWQLVPAGTLAGWPGRDTDHWGMSVYVVDPAGVCV